MKEKEGRKKKQQQRKPLETAANFVWGHGRAKLLQERFDDSPERSRSEPGERLKEVQASRASLKVNLLNCTTIKAAG